jgi:hypothetical protein
VQVTAVRAARAFAVEPHAPQNIAICTVMRNERRVLDEWIAFHWLQGVRHFVIYDDKSQDRPIDVRPTDVNRFQAHSSHVTSSGLRCHQIPCSLSHR